MSSHVEKYKPHEHRLVNANDLHQREHEAGGFNQKLAVTITRTTSTMFCAYAFATLAILGFPGLSAWLGPSVAIYVVWFSQTFLQLTFLPILSVGTAVLNRKTEIQENENYKRTLKIFRDVEAIIEQGNRQLELLDTQSKELDAHYQELTRQTHILTDLVGKMTEGNQELAKQTTMLDTALTPKRRPMRQEDKP